MELIFDHSLGKQEHTDVVLCRPMAMVDSDEEHEALERGWLALDHPVMNQELHPTVYDGLLCERARR